MNANKQGKRRLVIAGGTGFLGSALVDYFIQAGWEVVVLSRHPSGASTRARVVAWDGKTPGGWCGELERATAVINLAGRSVDCRYHERNRRDILQSRLEPTRALGPAISACAAPPAVWLNASTATIYRHTFGPAWDEHGEIGGTPAAKDEFSVQVARAWEQALAEAPTPRTRKVALRTAMVLGLGPNSVFPVLRRLARLGLGGPMGSGRQFVSWIHVQDFCRAAGWLIEHPELDGIVNLAAPGPVANAELMRQVRLAVGVPFGLPTPQWLLEIGAFFLRTETELIIKSRRVVPGRLVSSGFQFRFPTLDSALKDLCQSR